MGQAYRRTKKMVSLINYHFVFCPRYRRKVLVKQLVKDICQAGNVSSETIRLYVEEQKKRG
ncbi:transposase [Polycladomyces subterraneus]|uniref:IS200/IS605 family transposase n=1 Tax=Polycladomyces subterraneus TaxID=1016997 RepID=A0ABT8IJP2_9BACL|nr:transposase [Polycladomyces subterraneus]MDN4593010.1 hypothetical protein [Polycladomyces subterraneus]